MSVLSQFFGGNSSRNQELGTYGVGLSTGFSQQIPVDIMLIGGGGGGGAAATVPFAGVSTNIIDAYPSRFTGGTGGAGRGLSYTNCIVNTNTVYPITVGAGGAQNSKGGYSSVGIIRAGGGAAGGGQSPAGVPIIHEYGGLYGGSQGGFGASTPAITIPGGDAGIAPYVESVYSTGGFSVPQAAPLGLSPYILNSNSGSIFTQAINSAVHNIAPLPWSPYFGSNAFILPAGGGQFGGQLPVAVGYLGGGSPLIGSSITYNFVPGAPARWGLPAALISGSPSGNFMVGTTYNSFFTYYTPLGIPYSGGQTYGSIANHPSTTPANPLTGTVPASPVFAKYLSPFTPDFNVILYPAQTPVGLPVNASEFIPIGGGSFSVPQPASPSGQPFATINAPAQNTKSASWTISPNVNGSPGNGGGGGGGLRHAPVFMQGTLTQAYLSQFGFTYGYRITPYAVNIAGTDVPAASGGAGGSGSVWIIYPSDYAAATVTGNTPVPSPPAVRIYRWDGAGTITFNAS